MPLTTRVLAALAAGMLLGLALAGREGAFVSGTLAVASAAGTLFVSAIRMTVVPLVVSSLVSGVGQAPDPRVVGRIGARAVALFALFAALAAAFGVALGAPLLAMLPLDPAAVTSLRESVMQGGTSAADAARSVPGIAAWVVALVPVNPVRAAADGAMLPLIVATVLFAVALTQIAVERRAAVLRIAEGTMDASLALVRAIMQLAPVGVFALTVPLAATLGTGAIGALLGFIVIVSGAQVLFCAAVLYPLAAVVGRVPLVRFARAALPAQSIAFSARSSMAALPALLEAGGALGLSPPVTNFLIPLSATLFRAGAGIGQTIGALFVARLFGVDLGAGALATIALTSAVTSFSVPGIPGGSIVMMVPVLTAAGIPVEGIGILLGADTIPDMFRTTANVTAQMAVATVAGERMKDE